MSHRERTMNAAAAASTLDVAPPANPDLDAGRIDLSELPGRSLPTLVHGRKPGFQAVIRRAVLNEIHRHGRERTDVEICGVLVGNVYRDAYGPYLLIDSSIRGDAAEGHAAQVTFKAETWLHIQDVMDAEHPDRRIVGWYHTHPGFGIFLSGMDLFIQDNFFNLPWQIAFVYDPIEGDEGSFVWRNGRAEREPFLVDETMTREEAVSASWDWTLPTEVFPDGGAASGERTALAGLYGMQPRTTWIVAVVLFLAAFVVAGLLFAVVR